VRRPAAVRGSTKVMRALPPARQWARRTLSVVSLCAALLLLVGLCLAAPADDPAVVAARRRQDAAKSFAVEYKQTEVIAPGGLYSTVKPIPAEETTIVSTGRVVVDGAKVRFETNHAYYFLPGKPFVDKHEVCLFNGKVAHVSYPSGFGIDKTPQGIIERDAAPAGIKTYEICPIFAVFRGLSPVMTSWPYSDLAPSGRTCTIDDTTCEEYVTRPSAQVAIICWLDPAQDYLIRRVCHQSRGQLDSQIDIRYRLSEEGYRLPHSWDCNHYSATGSVKRSQRFEVLQTQINQVEPASQFEIEYPPGAKVNDQRTDKWYRVRSDGTMREFSIATGEDVLTTDSVAEPPWYRRHRWLLTGAIMVPAVAAAVIYIRMRKRANSRHPQA